MKICFLGDAESIHMRRWIEYFRDTGNDVSVISFRYYDIPGVDMRFVGEKIKIKENGGNIQYVKSIGKIKKIIKEIDPQVVNAHYLTSYGFIGALIKDRPFIVSTWGSDILVTPKRNIIYKKLTQFAIEKSDIITSDSYFMSNEIVHLGGEKNKVITVPMGIDKNVFNLDDREDFKSKIFLSMRTLCDNSNIDIILKAFKRINDEDKTTKLIITNSGEKKQDVLNLIDNLNLHSSVEFLGFINRDMVAQLLKQACIYISVPKSDSTSVTLLEAMACGMFPIVSDLPANNEWINDEKNGFILKDCSEESLYRLMKEAIKDEELLIKASELNKSIISERAIWEDNMNYIIKTYNTLILNLSKKMS